MRIRTFFVAGAISVSLATAALGAGEQDWNECNDHNDPNYVILACSKIIDEGAVSDGDRSKAYHTRAGAYQRRAATFDASGESTRSKEDRERAITDQLQSIALRRQPKDLRLAKDCERANESRRPTKGGWDWMAAKEYDSAIEAFTWEICYRKDRGRGYDYMGRAQAYEAKGDKQNADLDFDTARELLPEFPGAAMRVWTPDIDKRAIEETFRNLQNIAPN
jgi:tetratricopeptide (TPR) repeat protein